MHSDLGGVRARAADKEKRAALVSSRAATRRRRRSMKDAGAREAVVPLTRPRNAARRRTPPNSLPIASPIVGERETNVRFMSNLTKLPV